MSVATSAIERLQDVAIGAMPGHLRREDDQAAGASIQARCSSSRGVSYVAYISGARF